MRRLGYVKERASVKSAANAAIFWLVEMLFRRGKYFAVLAFLLLAAPLVAGVAAHQTTRRRL
jgi:hypothetical protein